MIGENQQKLILKLPDKDKEEDYSSDESWEDDILQSVPKKLRPKKSLNRRNNNRYNNNNNDWFDDQLNVMNQRWNNQNFMGNFIPTKNVSATLRCYPPHFVDEKKIAEGDKILLPASLLNALTNSNAKSPWLFEIVNTKNKKKIYASVLEFIAPEGMVFMPVWMINFIDSKAADNVTIKNVQLPIGKYAKLKPVNYEEFNKLSNARDLLEIKLRSFATLMKGSTISVNHSGTDFIFVIVDLKPEDAVCIINSDLTTEFDLPEGFKVPLNESKDTPSKKPSIKTNNNNQFSDDSDDDSDKSSEDDSNFKGIGYTTSSNNIHQQIDTNVESVVCKNCDKKIPKASSFSHEAFCYRNVVRCEDCGRAISKDQKENHMIEFHAPIKCDKCGLTLIKDMLETHQLFECAKRQIDCEFCNLSFSKDSFEEHVSHCGSRTEKCDSCQRRVQLKDYKRHKSSNCQYFPKNESPNRFVNQDIIICPECSHPFTDYSQLDKHVSTEHSSKKNKPTISFETVKKTTKNITPTNDFDDLFCCHICYQPYQQIEDLENHIKKDHKDDMDFSYN